MSNNNSKTSSSSGSESDSSGGDPRTSTKSFYFDLTQNLRDYRESKGMEAVEGGDDGNEGANEADTGTVAPVPVMDLEVKKERMLEAEVEHDMQPPAVREVESEEADEARATLGALEEATAQLCYASLAPEYERTP